MTQQNLSLFGPRNFEYLKMLNMQCTEKALHHNNLSWVRSFFAAAEICTYDPCLI